MSEPELAGLKKMLAFAPVSFVLLKIVAESRYEHVNPMYGHGKDYVKVTLNNADLKRIKALVKMIEEENDA